MVLTESNDELVMGDNAPGFKLMATDGKEYSLEELKGKKATLIVFMCNHCPYVIPKLKELNRIAESFPDLKVIGINPNEDKNYPLDSFQNMKNMVNSGKVRFPYLRDDTQEVAKAYGAICTPDPFLFDSELKLIYHGRIDDTHGDRPAEKHELFEAIKDYFETGRMPTIEHPSMGCSIKWKYSS